MKKQIDFQKLLAFGGALTCSLLFFGPPAMAQQEEAPKQVKLKIIRNLNGTVTEKDTVILIPAGGKLPDLSEMRSFSRDFSLPEGKEQRVIIKKQVTDEKGLSPAEIERMIGEEKGLKEDVRVFRILEENSNGLEKGTKHRVLVNKEEIILDGATFRSEAMDPEKLRALMKEKGGQPVEIKDLQKFRTEFKDLEQFRDVNATKMITQAGDSILVIRKVFFVKVDLNDAERELLNEAAKKETSAKKVKDLNLESVELYPNPTSGKFRISFSAPQKGHTTVILRDGTGRELMRDELGSFKGNYEKEFDLGTQPKGVYFVQVMQGKQVFNKKVMLQ